MPVPDMSFACNKSTLESFATPSNPNLDLDAGTKSRQVVKCPGLR